MIFFLNQISSTEKKSAQGENGIRPKSNQVSALKSYLNRGYIKFLYLWSFKVFTHLAVAWTMVTFVSKWTGEKVKVTFYSTIKVFHVDGITFHGPKSEPFENRSLKFLLKFGTHMFCATYNVNKESRFLLKRNRIKLKLVNINTNGPK